MKFHEAALCILAAGALLAAGCVTVRENKLADGSIAVEIHDNGWYIFGVIPIVSGNPDGRWPHWFTDDVTPEKTMYVLDRIVARENPEKIDALISFEEDEDVLFIINRLSIHTSVVIPQPSRVDCNVEKQ